MIKILFSNIYFILVIKISKKEIKSNRMLNLKEQEAGQEKLRLLMMI